MVRVRYAGAVDHEERKRAEWIAAEFARRLERGGDPSLLYLEVVTAWEQRAGRPPAEARRARSKRRPVPRPAAPVEDDLGFDPVATLAPPAPAIGPLARGELPAALLAAARRLQVPNPREAAARDRLVAGVRDALAHALRDGFGPQPAGDLDDTFGGALAVNDQRRADEDGPALETVAPAAAFAGLAAHAVVAGVRRSLTTAPDRLAARAHDGGAVSLEARPDLLTAIQVAANDAGEPLPPHTRGRFEHELGRPLGHVRVHTGPAASSAARAIGARAFTLGSHVYFADGELAPGTERGDALLRHELTHVIQHDEGRLRSKSGGLEVEAHDGTAEVEARAAERAPAATAPSTTPAAAASPAAAAPAPAVASPVRAPVGGNVVAGSALGWLEDRASDVGGGLEDAGRWAGRKAGQAAGAVGDGFMWVVERFSPRLADLIRRGPSEVVWGELRDLVGGYLGGLIPGNPLGAIAGFASGIVDFAGVLVGAATGDAGCCAEFARMCEKLGAFARKAATSEFVKTIKSAFSAIDSALATVIGFFGGTVMEAFRGQLQFVDEMGGWIRSGYEAIRGFLEPAADWVLEKLGLPSIADLHRWLSDLAARAWESIKSLAASGVAMLKEIGPKLLQFTALGPLIEMMRFSFELIEVTDWLITHRNDPDLVKNARVQMAHTFLPKLIDKTSGLVDKVQGAISWLETHLGELATVFGGIALAMSGILLPLGAVLIPMALAIRNLWPRIAPALRQLGQDIAALAKRAYDYAKPVIGVFAQLGVLIAFPWMLPTILISSAWLALPECLKPPILNLILDLMIAALEILPDSMALFGPLWTLIKAGAIGFLAQVRTGWTDDQKVMTINRLARMASGQSGEMMAGFVVGFGKGLVAGVLDPFKMVYELFKIGWELTAFLAKLVNHAPELATVIERHLPALQEHAEQIMAQGAEAFDKFLRGELGWKDIWALITSFMDSVTAQAGALGATVADKLKAWFLGSGTEYNIAEAIGIAIGFIIVFALITYFSGGIFAEAKGVIGVVAQIARILNLPFELLGAALKPLAKLFGPVIKVISSIGAKLGLEGALSGLMRHFEGFVNRFGRLVEDLLIAIERRVVDRSIENISSLLVRRLGQGLANRLIEELGAVGAEQVMIRLGENAVKHLGSVSGRALLELSLKFDEAAMSRMIEGGWSPAVIERLGLALDRTVVDGLMSSGLTGAQLERLATLSAQKLEGATLPALRRLAGLTELEFTRLSSLGETGFKRILGLGEAQFTRFMGVGEQQLRVFSELGDTAFTRFANLTDPQFARFGTMAPGELQRFAGLSDPAFTRFSTAADDIFLKFRSFEPAALERFGALPQVAFDRFAALDAAGVAKLENLSAGLLDELSRVSEPTLRRLTGLSDTALAKLDGLGTATLERLGAASEAELVSITQLERGRLQALLGELEPNALARLVDDLGPLRIEALTDILTPRGLRSVSEAAGNAGLELVERASRLEAGGQLRGVQDWVDFSITRMNKTGQDLRNVLGELTEAERLVNEGAGTVVVGRDVAGGGAPSIDLAVENGGRISREIDVTSVQADVTRPAQFNDGVTHALDKVGSSSTGTVESTIQVQLGAMEPLGTGVRRVQPNGDWVIENPIGTPRANGNLFDELTANLNGNLATNRQLSRVTITDRGGTVMAEIEQQGGRFVRVR